MSGQPAHTAPLKGNKEKVAKLISSVLEKVSKAEDISRDTIYHELMDLQHIIEGLRHDLGSVGGPKPKDTDISEATDELDAVVRDTASASSTIMDACEVIQDKAGAVEGENGEAIMNEVTKIFEACSFQDITGQRITKVIRTLKSIEEKVEKLLGVLGDKLPHAPDGIGKKVEITSDADLLNGPQLPGNAISQDEIDRLLADFDD
jgi:chemotaxis protein CheZ